MTIHIDIQKIYEQDIPVDQDEIMIWAKAPLLHFQKSGELTIRISSKDEIQQLNKTYRNKNKSTNVLAFPSELPDNIQLDLKFLGDIIISPEVLDDEAQLMNKSPSSHWAHIIIHGVLHLLGYDHIHDADAKVMQALEAEILKTFEIENPYSFKDIA